MGLTTSLSVDRTRLLQRVQRACNKCRKNDELKVLIHCAMKTNAAEIGESGECWTQHEMEAAGQAPNLVHGVLKA